MNMSGMKSTSHQVNKTATLRLANNQSDWSTGTLGPDTLPPGLWKRPKHLFQVVIIDRTIENPDGTASYYPYVFNTQDETVLDAISLPAGLDVLQTRVGTFMALPDLDKARRGVYTLQFQTALLMLAWRTALVPDPQRFAGAMTMVTHILKTANPDAAGLVVTMTIRDALLYPIVRVIKDT